MYATCPSKSDLLYLVDNKIEPLKRKIHELAEDMIMLLGMLDTVKRTNGIIANFDPTLPKLENQVSINCSKLNDILETIKSETHFL